MLAGIARLLAPTGEARVLVSVLPRDDAPAVPSADALADAYGRHGLSLVEVREATPVEVAASHSSWAKRLRAGAERPVTLLRAQAPDPRQRERAGAGRLAAWPETVAEEAVRSSVRWAPQTPSCRPP